MTEEQLEIGDDMIHGEGAYALGPCEAHERLLSGHQERHARTSRDGAMMGLEPGSSGNTSAKSREKNGMGEVMGL